MLTIGGGIATFFTAGAATLLLMAGFLLGVAAAGTGLGTAAVEAVVNSKQIRKAEKALQIADQFRRKLGEQVNEWKLSSGFSLSASCGFIWEESYCRQATSKCPCNLGNKFGNYSEYPYRSNNENRFRDRPGLKQQL